MNREDSGEARKPRSFEAGCGTVRVRPQYSLNGGLLGTWPAIVVDDNTGAARLQAREETIDLLVFRGALSGDKL